MKTNITLGHNMQVFLLHEYNGNTILYIIYTHYTVNNRLYTYVFDKLFMRLLSQSQTVIDSWMRFCMVTWRGNKWVRKKIYT